MTRAGPVDELIAKTPDWRGAMLAKLRKIVHDADPEIAEDVKWKRPSNPLGSAVWSHDGMVCVGIILKERVRLSFSAGSSLPDPKKLFNAQLLGKSRAIDVSQNEKLDEQAQGDREGRRRAQSREDAAGEDASAIAIASGSASR